jgi:4-coumarate--CoA ligase
MAQTIFIAGAVMRGIPVYIMKKFDFVKMLEAVQKYRITTLTMVPPIVVVCFPSTNLFYPSSNIHQALAKSPLTKKYDLSSVRDIGSGAAPLGGEVIEECEALWPARDRRLTQGWGMTEVTCSLLGWDPTSASIDPNSVGELNANCSAKIMDADGKNEVQVGQRGEIWVQGPK